MSTTTIAGHEVDVNEEGFLTVAARVMPRRDVTFTAGRRAALSATWRRLAGR